MKNTLINNRPGGGSSGLSLADGDKGDVVVSSSGSVWTVDNDAVTYAKIQNVSSTDRLLGRSSAGSGDIQEIVTTSFARTVLDDTTAATAKTTLGLKGYSLTVGSTGVSVSNGQTQYVGIPVNIQSTSTTANRIYIPKTGTIIAVSFYVRSSPTAGTAEGWALSLRVNDTSETAVQTLSVSSQNRHWFNDALSISVTAGDWFNLKLVNPTWATPPGSSISYGTVYII